MGLNKTVQNLFWQTLGFFIAVFYLVYRLLLPKKQGSHPVSRFFRKVFEHQKARTGWGITLLVIILVVNFFFSPPVKSAQAEQTTLETPENVILTETTYQLPVKGWITQGYHWYHPAIDISAELGEKIYPIGEGKVIKVEFRKWGYGHFVVIDHQQGYQSLYAHLKEIKVEPGQEVDKSTILGSIGMTGWTTGPHLHLEIYEEGKNINPLEVLPEAVW